MGLGDVSIHINDGKAFRYFGLAHTLFPRGVGLNTDRTDKLYMTRRFFISVISTRPVQIERGAFRRVTDTHSRPRDPLDPTGVVPRVLAPE